MVTEMSKPVHEKPAPPSSLVIWTWAGHTGQGN